MTHRSQPRTCCPESLAQSRAETQGGWGTGTACPNQARGDLAPRRDQEGRTRAETAPAPPTPAPCPAWRRGGRSGNRRPASHSHSVPSAGRLPSRPPRRPLSTGFHTRPRELALLRPGLLVRSGHWPLTRADPVGLVPPGPPGTQGGQVRPGARPGPPALPRRGWLPAMPPNLLQPPPTSPPSVSQGTWSESRSEGSGLYLLYREPGRARRPADTHRGGPSGPGAPPSPGPSWSLQEGLPRPPVTH